MDPGHYGEHLSPLSLFVDNSCVSIVVLMMGQVCIKEGEREVCAFCEKAHTAARGVKVRARPASAAAFRTQRDSVVCCCCWWCYICSSSDIFITPSLDTEVKTGGPMTQSHPTNGASVILTNVYFFYGI